MKSSAILRSICALILIAGCGGGGGTAILRFVLLALAPTTSLDLNGGDVVTITGTNFQAVRVASVRFGGQPGFNLDVESEETLTVVSPPAPGGVAGPVTIEVISLEAGSRFHPIPFVYVATMGPPVPNTIFPNVFTPTGAQSFTIQGSNLGPSGGTATVLFAGIGSVTAQVSLDQSIAPPASSAGSSATNPVDSVPSAARAPPG